MTNIDAFCLAYATETRSFRVTRRELPYFDLHFRLKEPEMVEFVLIRQATCVALAHIQAMTPGQRDGSRALRWLTNLADRHGVTLVGGASAKPGSVPDTEGLKIWYRKNGWEILFANGAMRYVGQRENEEYEHK